MLFPFIQYISPTWYFNLPPGGNHPYFPDYDKLPEQEKVLLEFDFPLSTSQLPPTPRLQRVNLNLPTSQPLKKTYSSRAVAKLDAAYQAWHKGFILEDPEFALDVQHVKPSIADNYRFIRRYFHPLWSWYVLCLRLITLHNPIREISGFLRHARVKRVNLYEKVYPHTLGEREMSNVQSSMSNAQVTDNRQPTTDNPQPTTHNTQHTTDNRQLTTDNPQPKVSVIIPTLNRYVYLKDALHDLEQQDYKNFEVIIVDQSEPFQPEFYEPFQLDLKLIRQEEKALWLARNTAIQQSDAEYLLLYDDDSRVAPDWISRHMDCLEHFQADISSGVSISLVGAKVPANYSFFRWSDQLDTGNVLIKREVFRRIGLFDRQFEGQRMGDGEFGLRAYLAGFKNISNPLAQRLHLKVSEGGLRQMGSWDGFRPKSWLAPRPVPSVLYLSRKYFGKNITIMFLCVNIPFSLLPYHSKSNYKKNILFFLLTVITLPLVFFQVSLAWVLSTHKIKKGERIDFLLN